jgi:serine protease Do
VKPTPWHLVVTVGLAAVVGASCGSTQRGGGGSRTRLTPPEIVEASKPAVVRVEVGADRVGTGFVIDKSGLIATNLHVVFNSDDIRVVLLDGTKYPAVRIVGFDVRHDLAVLDIDPPKAIPALKLGDSSALAPGDFVLAIGNPLGVLDYTVSDGLLSAVREIEPDAELLQITAPISQGSSGGPLFNNYGEVIGVVNAYLGGGQNLNFAIPAKYLRQLAATREPPLSMAEFKAKSEALLEEVSKAQGGDTDGVPNHGPKIVRNVPDHPLSVLDGCKEADLTKLHESIWGAIKLGAPLYNQGVQPGVDAETAANAFEACYRIYEGVVREQETNSPCKGVRTAFGDGLVRVETVTTPKEKAWALRDTFDGLLAVIGRWRSAKRLPPLALPGS